MASSYRHMFHSEGEPFAVRHDKIIAMTPGVRFKIDPETQQPFEGGEPKPFTLMIVEGLGQVAVDEEFDVALSIWDSTLL